MKHPDYPGVSSYTDNRGTTRYKFRRRGLRSATIPGQPHTPQFDTAYQAAVEGRVVRKAEVVPMPGAASPHSLDACWRELQKTTKWKRLQLESQQLYSRYAEEFLESLVEGVPGSRWGAGPVADLRPRHVAAVLDAWSENTPHKARTLFVVLQKLMKIAVLQGWINYDPTYGVDKPEAKTVGKKAWPPHVCARYELRWPIGTPARTAYELAKWLGVRRSDVASIRWDHMVTEIVNGEPVDGFKFIQYKGRNRDGAFPRFHPISPMLAEALAPLDRGTGTVLVQNNGRPYQLRIMTSMMRHWRIEAGIETGYSFHGLRHAMGAMLADADATEVQTQDVLGHSTIGQQNTYKKERNQARSAAAGMKAVVRLVRGV